MKSSEKRALLERAKQFFIQKIAEPHLENTKKLTTLSVFKINPFIDRYLARFYSGNNTPEALAQTLILPRVLGTSISTTFGSAMQKFCGEVLQKGFGNTGDGLDIEFIDSVDGRKKYCQVKSGPETINKDDIQTISRHFKSIRNRGRTNSVKLMQGDLCVGVLYGTREELSTWYRTLESEEDIPVFVGKEFWLRLTGDANFYDELIEAFAEAADETDATQLLKDVTKQLAKEIAERDVL